MLRALLEQLPSRISWMGLNYQMPVIRKTKTRAFPSSSTRVPRADVNDAGPLDQLTVLLPEFLQFRKLLLQGFRQTGLGNFVNILRVNIG